MFDPILQTLAIAAAIGLAIGFERAWRGFPGSAPFHVAPAAVGAFLVARQPGLIALFWFPPLQVLLWLVVTAAVCMWGAERTPHADGDFRGSAGLGLSWTLAFLLGVTCAFGAWPLLGAALTALVGFGLRAPRRRPEVVSAPAKAVEQSGAGEAVGGAQTGLDLKGVDGEAGGATKPPVNNAAVETETREPLLQLPAA